MRRCAIAAVLASAAGVTTFVAPLRAQGPADSEPAGTETAVVGTGGVTADEDHAIPHHTLVLFSGGTTETKREEVETGFALGLEYGYRFAELWAVGGIFEFVGREDVVRDVLLLASVSLFPWEGLRVLGAPGVEFTDTKDEFVLRGGLGYEFIFGGRWIVAPEIFVDWIGGSKITYVYGVGFGLEF